MAQDSELIRRAGRSNAELAADLHAAAREGRGVAPPARPEDVKASAINRAMRIVEIPRQMARIRQIEGRDNKPTLQRLASELHDHNER